MKRIIKNIRGEKGIALLITVVIISAVLLMVVFISNIVITQLRLAGDIADSAAAIYAADSGIEWQLYRIRKGVAVPSPSMSNGAEISTTVTGDYPNFTIKSLGSYRLAKRQFETSF
ncbi:hypothetical protein HY838_00300 [Candidatus Azambacteria bacterium]|nr:hypothetical protein [Candidatus Azambacteria bacterium]